MRKLLITLALLSLNAFGQVTTSPSVSGVAAPQSSVAITGGTINGASIGATSQSTGAFSTLAVGGTTLNSSPAAGFQYNGSAANFFVRTNGVEAYFTTTSDFYFGGIGAGSKMHLYANNADVMDFGSTGMSNGVSTNLLIGTAAPTISSGFGTSPSIVSSNGSTTFRLNVGTGGTATGGVVGLPTAAAGWNCNIDILNPTATNLLSKTVSTASTASTLTVANELMSTGAATAWPASTILILNCFAY